jgi:hypothetical protein
MRSLFQSHRRRRGMLSHMLHAVLLAGSMVAAPLFAAEPNQPSHAGHATPVAMPG